ncbi:MAG: DUF1573 domain-containing protein [bacterium]
MKNLQLSNSSISINHTWKTLILFFILMTSSQAQDIKRITPKLIDLGEVQEYTEISDNIMFINKSDHQINISKIKSTCGCTTTHSNQTSIMPGDTAVVAYTLNTAGYRGVIRKQITINFKEKNLDPVSYTLQAQINRLFEVQPSYLHYANLNYNPDTTVSSILTLINEQDKKIIIKKIHSDNKSIKIKPTSFTIKPKSSKKVTIGYTPAQKGYNLSYIIIRSDYSLKPELKISVFTNVDKF